MYKKRIIRKLIAFSASVAMLASVAITASASSFSTRTLYATGDSTIEVRTTVTGLSVGEEVTYLAINGAELNAEQDNVVYIDQYTAEPDTAGTQVFTYYADSTDINATVKMAKSDPYFSNSEIISKSDGGVIPDASKLNVTLDFGDDITSIVPLNPSDIELLGESGTLVLPIDFSEIMGKRIVDIKYGDISVEDLIIGSDSVSFTNPISVEIAEDGSFTPSDVTLNVVVEDIDETIPPVYVAGFKDLNYSQEVNGETLTGKAFAVCADASSSSSNMEYGVAVSETDYISNSPADVNHLKSFGTGADGKFAITLVDESAEAGKIYYFATYIYDGTNYTYGLDGRVVLSE